MAVCVKKNKLQTLFIVLFLVVFSTTSFAQNNPLKRKISIVIEEITLQDALIKIGQQGDFDFSYNAEILDGDKVVSLDAHQQTVQSLLEELTGEKIRWKVVSNHIILMRADKKKIRKETGPSHYVISGYIYDAQTGEKLKQATIFEVDGRITTNTDHDGFYSMKIPSNMEMRGLNYCKNGYFDTVIVIRPDERANIDIRMNPKFTRLTKVESISPDLNRTISERKIVNILVPREVMATSENLVLHEKRFAQVSFLPFVGSNRLISGSVTNKVSFNILAGYSNGVEGTEIGGFLNIVKKDVKGFQLAGFGNIVGGNTDGTQISGFSNVNTGTFIGMQFSGFSNVVWDTLSGVQISGFHNMLQGQMQGVQISGFNNVTTQYVDGLQLTGFANIALMDVRFAQLAGFFNYANNVGGGQLAGFMNYAAGDVKAVQAAGFINYARSVSGVQIAGFANISKDGNSGSQFATMFNHASTINGLQLGVINYCDTVASGVPIGFLSIVKKGYHRFELSYDDLFYANLAFKTGTHKFYNIFKVGFHDQKGFFGAYGFGTRINFSKRIATSIDLTSSVLFDDQGSMRFLGNINKISASFDMQLAKHFTIFLGPTVSLLSYETGNEFAQNLSGFETFYEESFEDVSLRGWFGGTIGIRL